MDKRCFSRIHFQTEAVVRFQDREMASEVVNLSLNGAFLTSTETIQPGEEVDVKILLSGTSSELSVKVKGKIIRQNEEGIAIQFTGMDLDSFMHLKNIVAYNSENVSKAEKEFEQFIWGKDSF